MKQIDFSQIIFIIVAMVGGFACTLKQQPLVETSVKIAARHLARRGIEKWPDRFNALAMISKSVCELGKGNELAIQGAFMALTKLITKDLNDPELKADFADLTGLIGVSLTLDRKLRDVSPDIQKILEVVVCEFARTFNQLTPK